MSPPSALRTAFQEALFPGTPGQQHGLMEAYPALGDEAVAERAASEDPTLDQASAAMTSRTEDEDRAFREVTTAYQEEFGSPAHRCASTVL